ncbi:hypothetical protein DPMN_174443 [Dreissena polymorpha]|uniref:Uncharacterized protein n=1 Tax=Dreissena polymorpha TaxID=45954 RepID=A0A9D4IF52_DREPO|nr:hypothetical protein DPMN_174443 [Dreissena polymorpha]
MFVAIEFTGRNRKTAIKGVSSAAENSSSWISFHRNHTSWNLLKHIGPIIIVGSPNEQEPATGSYCSDNHCRLTICLVTDPYVQIHY